MTTKGATLCSGVYEGNLIVNSTHELSSQTLKTDAPVDNQGTGASFSPTDLVGVSLATCILTTMGMIAKRDNFSIDRATYSVQKIMTETTPRKIKELVVKFNFPADIPEAAHAKLEKTVHACPVHHSLHPDITTSFEFIYSA